MAAATHSWMIRAEGQNPSLSALYGSNYNTYFTSLEIIHGGYFTPTPKRDYVRPKSTIVDFVEVHKISYELLSDIIKTLNYTEKGNFYRVEGKWGLDLGLMRLESSSDFDKFYRVVFPLKCNQVHRIFVEIKKKTHIACFPQSLQKASPDALKKILLEFVLENPMATIHDARDFVFQQHGVWITPYYLMPGLIAARREVRDVDDDEYVG